MLEEKNSSLYSEIQGVKISDNPYKMASYEKKEINNLHFNQEHNLFTCSMDTGVKVYNVDPLAIRTSLDATVCGSVGHCQVLHRTNLIALVGGGSKPKFADNVGMFEPQHVSLKVSFIKKKIHFIL